MKMKKWISLLLTVLILAGCFPATLTVSAAEEKNVALGAQVSAAVEDCGQRVTNMTDGNLDSYWDAGPCPSEATVDLGGFYQVNRINVVNYVDGSRSYQYRVECSVDNEEFEPLCAKIDNGVATKEGDDFDVDVIARYIKIILVRNTANPSGHVSELRVYGTPEPDFKPEERVIPTVDPEDAENIAYRKPVRTNSENALAIRAVDGKSTTYWQGEDIPRYLDVDLGDNYDITDVTVVPPQLAGQTFSFAIYGSRDGIRYDKIGECKLKTPTKAGIPFKFETPVCYRILRVLCTSNSDASSRASMIAEIKVHGKQSATATAGIREKLTFTSYEDWLRENCGVDTSKIKNSYGQYDIEDTYTADDTIAAVQGIIRRNLGEKYIDWFTFEIAPGKDGYDYYEISSDADGRIRIKGNKGVSLTTGLNYYLKYYCFVEIAQQTVQGKMPATAPAVSGTVKRSSPYEVRYAYNYCTLSYTMSFFGYDDWQRELDYLALNGVNLILDTTATEALWVCYLQELGYTADEAKDFVCGYAYKAWWLMGNLQGYGGPVSDQWIYDTLEMARVNERFMTVLGIRPALQAFVGMFPLDFAEQATDTLVALGYGDDVAKHLVDQGIWNGAYRQPMLMANTYDGYDTLAEMFYDAQRKLYGPVTHYYCGDLCHEGGTFPQNSTREGMSGRILQLMIGADPEAVWIMQVWGSNPTAATLTGFGDDREDHILLLDLTAAHQTKYETSGSYGGKEFRGTSWVYCILDNYGGRYCMHGSLQKLIDTMTQALEKSEHMKGIGITPEGTQQNPIVFDLFWELAWEQEAIDLDEWVAAYIHRRYGAEDGVLATAWESLMASVYSVDTADGMGTNAVLNHSPGLGSRGDNFIVRYDNWELECALDAFMTAFDRFCDEETYVYDVVEVMMQYLSNVNYDYYDRMKKAYDERNLKEFNLYRDKFLDTMELIDEIAGYGQDTLLGTWLGKADAWLADERTGEYDDFSRDMMRFNAGALITVWGGQPLTDYANRQYAGLLRDYYIPAWRAYLNVASACLAEGKGISGAPTANEYFARGWKLAFGDTVYTTEVSAATGDRFARGLKEIYNHIKNNHRESIREQALLIVEPTRRSGYEREGGVLRGVKAGTTFDALKEGLQIPTGTTLVCEDTDALRTGSKVRLCDADGHTVDSFVIEVALTEEETARREEILGTLAEFLAEVRDADPATFGDRADAVLAAKERAEYLTGTLRAYPIGDYEQALSLVNATKATPTTDPDPTPTEPGRWIVFVIVGAVLLTAAVVALLLVKAKKKKA